MKPAPPEVKAAEKPQPTVRRTRRAPPVPAPPALPAPPGPTVSEPVPSAGVNYLHLPTPDTTSVAKSEQFIRNWLVLGPFTYETGKHGGDQDQGAAKVEFVPNESGLTPTEGAEVGGKKWQRYARKSYTVDPEFVDLDEFYGGPDYCAAYLGCYVYAPQDLANASLCIGSDDYAVIWINGKKVFTYDLKRRAPVPDQDTIKNVSLNRGKNVMIVKVVDVVKRWGFYGRFADAQERPLSVTDAP